MALAPVGLAGLVGLALSALSEWGEVLDARAPLRKGEMNHRGERDEYQRDHLPRATIEDLAQALPSRIDEGIPMFLHAAFACFAARTIARIASSTSISSVR